MPGRRRERLDPSNMYLHRMNVRRLEAEAIRDAHAGASRDGWIRRCMGRASPCICPASWTAAAARRSSGPLDGDGRRSIYLSVRRNFLNPMFLAFDAPVPFSTMGRRNVSNVPAQALTLLNDPLVVRPGSALGRAGPRRPAHSDRARIDDALPDRFRRPPTEPEARVSLAFLNDRRNRGGCRATSRGRRCTPGPTCAMY